MKKKLLYIIILIILIILIIGGYWLMNENKENKLVEEAQNEAELFCEKEL